MVKSYRELKVWQKAMDFVAYVYKVQKDFPAEERYGLCDQLRRAAVSIPSNIAEGRGRDTAKDFTHFLTLARGSLNEVATQLELAFRLGYLDDWSDLYEEALEIRKMLNAMIVRLKQSYKN
jgi:four helix bundle protein